MSEATLLIDQGSHASRARVLDAAGTTLAHSQRPLAIRRPAERQAEYDGEDLVRSVRECIDEVVEATGLRPARAALATQRSTVACWDRETGRPLAPVLSWQDLRAALPALDPGRLAEVTGLRASPHYGAAKLRWYLDHVPGARLAAESGRLALGPLAAFLVARLCPAARPRVDACNAARTLLLDLDTAGWSSWLLEAFDLQADWLPQVVSPATAFGELDTPRGPVPLTLVSGDQSVVPFAAGPVDSSRAWIQFGTGAFVQRLSSRPAAGLLRSLIWFDADGPRFTVEGTVNGAGSAIESECGRHGVSWPEMRDPVCHRLGAGDVPVFLNGFGGLGSPDWQSDFLSRWLDAPASAVDALSGVLESVLFAVNRNLDRMGPGINELVVSGGLSLLAPFCQALADLSRHPVRRPEESEATLMGLWALSQGRKDGLTPRSQSFEPNPREALARRYARWTEAMPAVGS